MVYERQEKVTCRITLLETGEKQGFGSANFRTADGILRFANFTTEDCVDGQWSGKNTEIFEALQKTFDSNTWITLTLYRFQGGHDIIIKTEAAEMPPQ